MISFDKEIKDKNGEIVEIITFNDQGITEWKVWSEACYDHIPIDPNQIFVLWPSRYEKITDQVKAEYPFLLKERLDDSRWPGL